MVTGLLADAYPGITALGDEPGEAIVVAFGGDENVIEPAPSGFEGFGNRMHAVEDFHGISLDCRPTTPWEVRHVLLELRLFELRRILWPFEG